MSETERKIKARSAVATVRKYVPEQLAFWPEDRRAIANELARCALFRCTDSRKKREYFDNVSLFMLGEGTVTYKGEELREKDEELFVTLAHMARDLPSGKMIVRTTNKDICKAIGWPLDQRYYNDIYLSIQRMKAGAVTIFSRRLAKAIKCQRAIDTNASQEELAKLYDELAAYEKSAFSERPLEDAKKRDDETGGVLVSLISGEPTFTGAKSIKNNIPQGNLSWEVMLDRNMVLLFAKPYITMVNREARRALDATGKRLLSYYQSHRRPNAVKCRSLEQMLGLNIKDLAALKFYLSERLKAIKELGEITEYSFTRSADKTDWLVHVTRPTDDRGTDVGADNSK